MIVLWGTLVFFGTPSTQALSATDPGPVTATTNVTAACDLPLDGNLNGVRDEGEPRVLYVNDDAQGLGNGTSWEDAFTDLQEALSAAAASLGAVEEIWVAQGTYRPAPPDGSRMVSFQLLTGVGLYGGFGGYETNLDQRDPTANETTLSGDLNGNDVGFEFMDDNSYHVVDGSDTESTAVLDGFTILGGNTSIDAPPSHQNGGGMFINNGSPTVERCRFTGNRAYGGGGLTTFRNSHPRLVDCHFVGNHADNFGGGVDVVFECHPTIRNCIFQRNSAKSGGGLHIGIACIPTVETCLFNGNSVKSSGGAIRIVGAPPTLANCTFVNNTAVEEGGAFYNLQATPTLTSCIVWSNSAPQIGEAVTGNTAVTYSAVEGGWPGEGNTSEDPLFVDADGPDDILGTDDDNVRLLSESPCVNAGNAAITLEPDATDLDGNPRQRGCRVDMGAYETDVGQMAGDFDFDGNIDLGDYGFFRQCLSGVGSNPPWPDACLCLFDFDQDNHVSLHDYGVFLSSFERPSR